MVDVQIRAYKQQYNTNWCSAIPGNIFGEQDNHDLELGHVVPALIHKFYIAKRDKTPVKVWGSGKAYREFIYAEDAARLVLGLLELEQMPQRMIISSGKEVSIKSLVSTIAAAFEYGRVQWDTKKPDGQLHRPSDSTVREANFPDFKFTELKTAIKKTVDWFEVTYPKVRK